MERKTHTLLEKFVRNSITSQEGKELKDSVAKMSDEELTQTLSDVWENYGTSVTVPDGVSHFMKKLSPAAHSHQPHFLYTFLKVAAAVIIPVLLGTQIYFYYNNEKLNSLLNSQLTVQVESGDKTELILPDGTKVYLNATTSFSYPSDFGLKNRSVYLSGEAYLEVAKDVKKPFYVHTENVNIEVLGTKFNICAYPEQEHVETMLIEGSVKLTTTGDRAHAIVMKPHEKVVYSKLSDSLYVSPTSGEFETAWMRGELVFRSTCFSDIMNKLEKRYGMKIEILENEYNSDLFTGSFKEDNIYDVLKILQMHYDFTYMEKDGKIVIQSE